MFVALSQHGPNRKEPSIPRVKPWTSEPKLTLYLSMLIALSICCSDGKLNAILGDSFPVGVRLASLDKHFKSQCKTGVHKAVSNMKDQLLPPSPHLLALFATSRLSQAPCKKDKELSHAVGTHQLQKYHKSIPEKRDILFFELVKK